MADKRTDAEKRAAYEANRFAHGLAFERSRALDGNKTAGPGRIRSYHELAKARA